MKPPEEEQQAIDRLVEADVLVVDELGNGESAYGRLILQEILDARDFADRGGLIVTSQFSVSALARRWNERSIPSRLAGMCRVVEVRGGSPTGRAAPPRRPGVGRWQKRVPVAVDPCQQ